MCFVFDGVVVVVCVMCCFGLRLRSVLFDCVWFMLFCVCVVSVVADIACVCLCVWCVLFVCLCVCCCCVCVVCVFGV